MALQKWLCKIGLHNYNRLVSDTGYTQRWLCRCGKEAVNERY